MAIRAAAFDQKHGRGCISNLLSIWALKKHTHTHAKKSSSCKRKPKTSHAWPARVNLFSWLVFRNEKFLFTSNLKSKAKRRRKWDAEPGFQEQIVNYIVQWTTSKQASEQARCLGANKELSKLCQRVSERVVERAQWFHQGCALGIQVNGSLSNKRISDVCQKSPQHLPKKSHRVLIDGSGTACSLACNHHHLSIQSRMYERLQARVVCHAKKTPTDEQREIRIKVSKMFGRTTWKFRWLLQDYRCC